MSEHYVSPYDGHTETRYTKWEARFILSTRVIVVILTLPFYFLMCAVLQDDRNYDNIMGQFSPKSIRLIGGEFYP